MKKFYFFACFAFLLTGCLDKNNNSKFNVEDNYIIVPSQNQTPKEQKPIIQEDVVVEPEIITKEDLDEYIDEEKIQKVVEVQQEEVRYSIDEILNVWGSPTKVENGKNGNKSYIWQSCNPTGNYKTVCSDDECSTEPETKCCTTKVNVDKEDFITNYKSIKKICD